MNYQRKIVSVEQLREIVKRIQSEGKTVVQCHGCFDILHPGHLRHLSWAKQQGDLLIVSVSADNVVGKGMQRPYVPQDLRAENIAALEVVDYVTIDANSWAGPILETLKPNIYVKGREFQDVYDGRFGRERQLVESYDGKVRFSSGDVVYSSTQILQDYKDRLEPVREQVHGFCRRHNITQQRIVELVERFPIKKVLVVGDTIIDKYVHCDRLGMSADAPVLVVRPQEFQTFLGGAAIVAQHVHSFGAQVQFLSVVGDDSEATYARAELQQRGVPALLIADSSRHTTVKTRYLSDGKKLLNVNSFHDHNLDTSVTARVLTELERVTDDVDCVAMCDFSYGVITRPVMEALCNIGANRRVPIIGDVQSSSQMGNVARLKGITLTTPSEREARLALCDRESGIADLGAILLSQTGNEALIITLADRGMMVFDTQGKPLGPESRSLSPHEIKQFLPPAEYLPSFATWLADSLGAGDALLATTACCLAAGGTIMESAFLGNCTSAVECRKMGNVPVNRDELLGVVTSQFQPVET